MRITSITIYQYTIDSICAEHIYDWRYHPSDKEIYIGSKCCEKLSSNNNKFCTKAIESCIIPSAEISDNQFGFRESRGTAFACNLLNDVTSYCKSRNSPLFLAKFDAEKCFDSICHVSLFLKLIDVLPTYQWLLLYNWYRKLNAVVKSKLSPYLFNIFINQLLLDLNDCDVGVRIGDVLYNSMAYADDIAVFSTNA